MDRGYAVSIGRRVIVGIYVFVAAAIAPGSGAVAGEEVGGVSFFNMNGGPRDSVKCTPPFTKCLERVGSFKAQPRRSVNCKNSNACKNDEARSAILYGPIKAGWKMFLYDHPDGKKTDDWTEVHVIRDMPTFNDWVTIGTFERTYIEHYVRVVYHSKNGLDGKVSRVEIVP